MRYPADLMRHNVDVYFPTVTQDQSGGITKDDAIQFRQMPCFVQQPTTDVVQHYQTRQQVIHQSLYMVDSAKFASITEHHRIVFNGTNYRVLGTIDGANFGVVFRIDLQKEVAGG